MLFRSAKNILHDTERCVYDDAQGASFTVGYYQEVTENLAPPIVRKNDLQ